MFIFFDVVENCILSGFVKNQIWVLQILRGQRVANLFLVSWDSSSGNSGTVILLVGCQDRHREQQKHRDGGQELGSEAESFHESVFFEVWFEFRLYEVSSYLQLCR